MSAKRFASQLRCGARVGLASMVMLQMSLAGPFAVSTQANDQHGQGQNNRGQTATPRSNM